MIRQISRDDTTFSSEENTATSRYTDGTLCELIEANRALLLNMDAPAHTKLRAIVSRGFTPRAISELRDALAVRATEIVTRARDTGSGNFIAQEDGDGHRSLIYAVRVFDEPKTSITLQIGAGYGSDPEWRHGQWMGHDWQLSSRYDTSLPEFAPRHAAGVVEYLVSAECDGTVGAGMFEHRNVGRQLPSGFEKATDTAR